ncbi:MAG: SAM-dependent chlorinase/fluorinase [Chloroflexi bacterium]|nr:MAG: SAM-dependent chlorinase/fluorinase [Chloroflexota bacterium]
MPHATRVRARRGCPRLDPSSRQRQHGDRAVTPCNALFAIRVAADDLLSRDNAAPAGETDARTMRRPIVFVTDYGRDDAYAAALTGAVWRFDPRVVCLEGTHGVPPGDVLAGAYHLKSLALAFDREIVLCGVVDPGVGTARRAIAIDAGGVISVAPDNGLVSYLWAEAPAAERAAVALEIPYGASATFHGRDVFAPAAAQLASGVRLREAGEPIAAPLVLDEAFAHRDGSALQGRVILIDHFGNAITTIRARDIVGTRIARVRWETGATESSVATYDEIDDGVATLIGSAGHLEIAARRTAALERGGPTTGGAVTVELA